MQQSQEILLGTLLGGSFPRDSFSRG